MSTAGAIAAGSSQDQQRLLGLSYVRGLGRGMLPPLLWFWSFSGAFVLIEPSPYEAAFLLVLGAALLAGTGLHRSVMPPFNLLLLFTPFALIAAFLPRHFETLDSFIYVIVTIYLWLTAFVVANIVTEAPRRNMQMLIAGYTSAALFAAAIGTLAYLRLIPGEEIFLRFGRARATFQDPNVFGPFLVLPAMYALQRIFLTTRWRMVFASVVFLALLVGVFVSFSRGAWAHLFASSLIVFFAVFVFEATGREKVRMLMLAILGTALLAAVLAALLSIDMVSDLFFERAALVQNYDTGASGRFGRQAYALELALANPFGLGPFEFTALRIIEDPHNTFIKVILTYGWGGGRGRWRRARS